MSTPAPPASEDELKPHWQTPAAAAGAMAAGLMVGRKSALGVALGVAAMAGARWLLSRHGPNLDARPTTGTRPVSNDLLLPAKPALAVPETVKEKPASPHDPASETSASVMIYEQHGEMQSCNAAPEGTVWFALFNEAPQAQGEITTGLATPAEKEAAAGGAGQVKALAESLFSESPGIVESVEEHEVLAGHEHAPAEVLPGAGFAKPDAGVKEAKSTPDLSEDMFFEIEEHREELPMVPPPQIVAKPPTGAAERVPWSATTVLLPQKRAIGELPRAWMVSTPGPPPAGPVSKDANGVAVHRSIVPHEMLPGLKPPRRWPLVTAALLVLLAAAALLVVSTGLDGGLVKEWQQRWMNSNSSATNENDVGVWSKDRSISVSAPTAGR